MADGDGFRERLAEIVRASAVSQARAYRDYSSLLDRLCSRDIETVQFAREAVDLYLGAVGKAASSGVTLVGEALSAGVKGVSLAASATAEAAQKVEKEVARDAARSGARATAPARQRRGGPLSTG